MYPEKLIKIVNGKRYNTVTSVCLAGNDYWDGSNFERHGRNEFLFRSLHGNYFTVGMSMWQGEQDIVTPISKEEAKGVFESLREKRVSWEEAFDESPEEA